MTSFSVYRWLDRDPDPLQYE